MISLPKISTLINHHLLRLGTNGVPKYPIARFLKRVFDYRKLRLAALELQRNCGQYSSLERLVETACTHSSFRSQQIPSEILHLLNILKERAPSYICEIGSAEGGTLFLLSKVANPNALIISIDLSISFERCLVNSRLSNSKQEIVSIRGNSRTPGTIRRVQSILRGHKLDLLFIDGDHSYEGVKADFLNYKEFVCEGGLVVFHDIVPDFRTRFGIPTDNDTGDVPRFWSEILRNYHTAEIIDDTKQDGYGIGLVYL